MSVSGRGQLSDCDGAPFECCHGEHSTHSFCNYVLDSERCGEAGSLLFSAGMSLATVPFGFLPPHFPLFVCAHGLNTWTVTPTTWVHVVGPALAMTGEGGGNSPPTSTQPNRTFENDLPPCFKAIDGSNQSPLLLLVCGVFFCRDGREVVLAVLFL